jgi:hypothetical protein
MKIILLPLAALSAVCLIDFSSARAEDPLPPVPPGSSFAPAQPPSSTTTPNPSTSQQVPLSPGAGKMGDHAKRLQKLKEELGLTPDQLKRMGPILKTAHEQAKAVRENSSLSIEQKRQQERQIFGTAFRQFKPILTPAQLAKLKQLRNERRGAAGTTTTTST